MTGLFGNHHNVLTARGTMHFLVKEHGGEFSAIALPPGFLEYACLNGEGECVYMAIVGNMYVIFSLRAAMTIDVALLGVGYVGFLVARCWHVGDLSVLSMTDCRHACEGVSGPCVATDMGRPGVP